MEKTECTRRISSSSTSSMLDDDPLMKDCIVLRQQLIETEQSLRNLTVTPQQSLNSSGIAVEKSLLSEHAPVLTLADLTPISSENAALSLSDDKKQRMHSSLNDIEGYRTIPKQETKSAFSLGTHTDVGNLRKKLFSVREENSSLFIQNNKLMTELEKNSYKLKQCQDELQEINFAVHEGNQLKQCSIETIETLEGQIRNKNHTIKKLEQMVIELRRHLKQQDFNEKEQRKRFEESLEKEKNEIFEWKHKFQLQKEKEDELKGEIDRLSQNKQQAQLESQKERSDVRNESDKMKSENLHLQQQISALKKELVTLQETSTAMEGLTVENTHLKTIIGDQQKKLTDYEEEVTTSKEHMTRLEKLIQKIQEDRLTSSRTDSGIAVQSSLDSIQTNELYTSPRAVIADLNLKLAMKDTEIQKLKTILSSTTFSQQKMKADYEFEENNIRGLRSELTSVMERTRQGDVKQFQLEHSITRMEEELSSKTTQIVELNERLSDKVALVTSLESKLTNRNNKIVALQTQLDDKQQEYEDMEKELKRSIQALYNEVNDKKWSLEEKGRQLGETKSLVESYSNQIVHLENALLAHGEETKATDELVNKIKTLHAEHCRELEKEIARLQKNFQEKNDAVVKLEKRLENTVGERKSLESTVNELKVYMQKMDELMQGKKNVIETYEEKIKVIQSKADQENRNIVELQENLHQCKTELQTALTDMEEMKKEYKHTVTSKTSSIQYLTEDLTIKTKHIQQLEDSYKKALEMLDQSQQRITELEDTQSRYEHELTQEKQNSSLELRESKQELNDLQAQVKQQEENIRTYEVQVQNINTAFEEAKNKIIELGHVLKAKEDQLLDSSNKLLQREEEVKKVKKAKKELESELNELKKSYRQIRDEKEELVKESANQLNALRKQCSSLENKIKDVHQKNADRENYLKSLHHDHESISEAYRKIERMMSISNDNVNIKEKELSDCLYQLNEAKQLLNEQKWKFKQKAAQFTQLEMSYKQEKSDYEKKVSLSEGHMAQLKEALNQKDNELAATKKKLIHLQMEHDEMSRVCFEHETRLKLHENSNLNTSTELKSLKDEIVSCKMKLKQQSDVERELEALRNQSENIQLEIQKLENELMSSQQTVLELTNELDQAHALLTLKESDCTRLARELGASQVREAQEKAQLNQELRKSLQEQEWKVSIKNEELGTIRDKNEDLVATHQQEVMKLRLRLQRSEDERKLANNDLERTKHRVRELEEEVKQLSTHFQAQQQKTKELNETLVLRESEAARYSARLSGYERGILTGRTKSTGRSDESNFVLKDNLFSNVENAESGNDSAFKSIKGKTELEKSRTQVHHGSSLDALLKRTEEELRSLNLTTGLNSTPVSERSFDVSLSDVDTLSVLSYDAP